MSTNYHLIYPQDPCPTCQRDRNEPSDRHIGLHSGGWVFLWHGYEASLSTPGEWFAHLRAETERGAVIVDEYRVQHDVEAFEQIVLAARGLRQRRHSALAHSRAVHVEGDDVGFHEFS